MKIRVISRLTSSVLLVFCCAAMADGYRPESDLSTAFVNDMATAEIVVYPTIVHDPYICRYCTASRQLVIDFLETNGLGTARAVDTQIYLGKPEGKSQFEMFQNSMRIVGEHVSASQIDADYIMVLEVLFPPGMHGRTEVFGIHVYVLTPAGDNAFSFLLNSHHKSFVKARLSGSKDTAKGKEKLAIKATRVAMDALEEQISQAGS